MASFSAAAEVYGDLEDQRGLVARLQVTASERLSSTIPSRTVRYPNRPDTPRASIEWLTTAGLRTMPGLFHHRKLLAEDYPKTWKGRNMSYAPISDSDLSPDKEEGTSVRPIKIAVSSHSAPSDRALKEIADDEVVSG